MHAQNKWTFTYLVLSLELLPHVAFSVLLQKISQSSVCSFWNQILIWIHDVGWMPGELMENVGLSPSEIPTSTKSCSTELYPTRSGIINCQYFYVAYWGYYGWVYYDRALRPTADTPMRKCKIELKGDQNVCNLTIVYFSPRLHKYYAIFPNIFYTRNSEERLGFFLVRGDHVNLIDLYEQVKDAIFNLDINA